MRLSKITNSKWTLTTPRGSIETGNAQMMRLSLLDMGVNQSEIIAAFNAMKQYVHVSCIFGINKTFIRSE